MRRRLGCMVQFDAKLWGKTTARRRERRQMR
jgi:hypothetical protein